LKLNHDDFMKIFLIYRFTGENFLELEKACNKIITSLHKAGHTCFCSISKEEFYKKNHLTRKEIYLDLINEIDKFDTVLCVVTSNEKSEGMIFETGYAFAKGKRIILAIKNGIKSELIEYVAHDRIDFNTYDELCDKLSKIV